MAYTLTTSDGSVTITIPDGQFDNSTGLTFAGPNAVGYGQSLDQNILTLLDNFASNSSPSGTNLQGQLWFNKSNQTLNVFTTQGYLPVSGITISTSQPTNANPGNTWFNSSTNQYYFYDGTNWNLIGPLYTKANGVSGAIPVVVNDASIAGVTHNIVKLQFGNVVIATLSLDPAFVPTPTIGGFSRIYPGITINESLIGGSAQLYTNANTAAYLPVDPTIINIQNNINNLNGNINTVAIQANATIAAANVAMANSLLAANISISDTINSAVINLNNQANSIITTTNANLALAQANINTIANALTSNISTVLNGLNGVTLAWTANAATQQVQIDNLSASAYTNANVAAYLPVYGGPIGASTITATTPAYNDNSTKVATTAFIHNLFPPGIIMMWNSTVASIPVGWQLCNGSNGTPDLRGQFIIGAGSGYTPGQTGGALGTSFTLNTSNLPSHSHSYSGTVAVSGFTSTGTASISDPGHSHTTHFNRTSKSNNSTPYMLTDPNVGENLNGSVDLPTSTALTGITDSGHTHGFSATGTYTGSTSSVGTASAVSVNTIPPFYALCYIQKMV